MNKMNQTACNNATVVAMQQPESVNTNFYKDWSLVKCSLFGSHVCQRPNGCDGFHRKCDLWKNHSSK